MKRGAILFLKAVIGLIALGVGAGMLRFPLTEGRAANLELLEIYADPLIIYVYLASIPFYVGLVQGYKLLDLIEAGQAFTPRAIGRLKHIRWCSLTVIGLVIIALVYLRLFMRGEDLAGPTILGLVTCVGLGVVATGANIFQKLFEKASELKAENDLTV